MIAIEVDSNLKGLDYEIFIDLLAIVSIIDSVIYIIPGVSPATKDVLNNIQLFLTIFFIIDFLYRFITAKSKSQYFFWDYGWADLLSCWPGDGLRFLRMFRLAKVYRLMKSYGCDRIIGEIKDKEAQMAIYIIVVLAIIILQIGGVLGARV